MKLAYYKGEIVITSTLQLEMVLCCHYNLNRPGAIRTHKTVLNYFYFPLMEKCINSFVEKCINCTKNKDPSPKYGLLPPATNIYEPWECFQIDLIGP